MLKGLSSFSLPQVEEEVLRYWRATSAFKKSLAARKGAKAFVFYEGPPTANGRPGIHHVLARSFKDIICRYKTMRGFSVPRKGGWDTHGLPVELEVEKQLGLRSKKDIEAYGVEKFNEACRASVWTYKEEWERLTERIGFWLDMERPYVTYESSYMESLWWILKEVYRKKLLFEGYKVVPWCTRCGTALSSHELALGYQEVKEESVFLKFRVMPGQRFGAFTADDRTYILSWTTTPWTLPGNVALAVNPEFQYRRMTVEAVEGITEYLKKGDTLVFANDTDVEVRLFGDKVHENERGFADFSIGEVRVRARCETLLGSQLVGIRYEPLFRVSAFTESDTAYRIYPASFVTKGDGTGVVHTAVMYGADDYELGLAVGLPQHHTVDGEGKFTGEVPDGLAGRPAKSPETDKAIFKLLMDRGSLLKTEAIKHDYPFCWRCATPLLYYARASWFIKMSAFRKELLAANRTIEWTPSHLREGRFGEWLREVKDWAISRARYWGTPLPVWRCDECAHTEVLGSIAEVSAKLPKSSNRYILVRHGEAESNTKRIAACFPEPVPFHLTPQGRRRAERAAKKLARTDVDLIVASDLTRTKETAAIFSKALGVRVKYDTRLRELDFGEFNGRSLEEYRAIFGTIHARLGSLGHGAESITELRTRLTDFFAEMERQHREKTIMVVSHGDPLWVFRAVLEGTPTEMLVRETPDSFKSYPEFASPVAATPRAVPRNRQGELDLHRPYIDEVTYACAKCRRGTMRRVPEVVDVWFDSGAMPLAQEHWPFDTKGKPVPSRRIPFPADYISEAMDQTRGWFYTLLAVSTLLGRKAPFKHVISLGLLLDRNGQKMSKSKGNVVSPWDMTAKYGADSLRWHFYTVNPPGEAKRFDERELERVNRSFFGILYNSFVFYDTYGEAGVVSAKPPKPAHILDRWIMARLKETATAATTGLETYEVGTAARSIEEFVGDLSRWYIRRSRRRLQQPASAREHREVSQMLRYALVTMAQLIAPFTPFFAEALWQSLVSGEKAGSVHLAEWPSLPKPTVLERKLIADMAKVRMAASAGLAARATAGVKVRQPLQSLTLKDHSLRGKKELVALIMEEVNVKEVRFNEKNAEEVVLDTAITHALREEGWRREFIRAVQELRQSAKLKPGDSITLAVEVPEELRFILTRDAVLVKKEVRAARLSFGAPKKFIAESATDLGGLSVRCWIGRAGRAEIK